ncbi:MAG: DUF6547 family protein [Vulcanimicrobiota bacterium]
MENASRYKRLIDLFVSRSGSITSRKIRNGDFSNEDRDINDFVKRLDKREREILGNLLEEERKDAFHDVLFILVENKIGLHDSDGPIDYDYTQDYHGDYVHRLAGEPWYDED